jgi:NAD(P)H-dependent FMN reductase
LLIGLAGTVVSVMFKNVIRYLPQLIPYRTALQVASVLVLILGVYLKGGYAVESMWRERVKELEAKVALAEAESKVVNTEVKEKIVERVRVVKETQVVIQEKLRDVQVTVDSQCKIHPKVIDILNEAALNPGAKK